MPIIFNDKTKEFHLYNNEVSYIFKVLKNNQLGQLYYGKKIRHNDNFDHLVETAYRVLATCKFDDDNTFSLEHIKQEYPSYGSGDLRYPAFEISQENGSSITDFQYVSHKIIEGKPELKNLPATYVEDNDEASTLEILLHDSLINTDLILSYTIYNERPVITRSVRFINKGDKSITITNAMSASVDLPDSDYEMVELCGAWARERNVNVNKLHKGIQSVYSMRGASSANYNPFISLKRHNTDEFSGEAYGFSFVYSGNFLAQVEVDTYDVTRITMGINPNGFNWTLNSDEEFQTPEVVMVYSNEGLNGMSKAYHELYRTRLARGYWRDKERPILINNWEATYFDFDEEKILSIAEKSKDLGIELFVLDDGWFGTRNDDTQALGDWFVNTDKLPNGITGLAKKIESLGMKFGLWFEPEMTNKNSELYKAHPDWILHTPGRTISTGRNQYVLDFSRKEVVDYIYESMYKTLSEAPISYVKWDMNRNISECYSVTANSSEQGKIMHKYILGVYDLYSRLIKAFPHILFESCASGGGRFDPGMLYYAPQAWTSDDTDAIERLKIQYGTSMVYPISSMGSHVSAVPNHQLFRKTSIDTRANVAYFGTFGYELDVNKITEEESEKIKEQVIFMKKHRKLISSGTFYRLLSPFENNITAWMVVSQDKKQALVGYYKVLNEVNASYKRVKLKGLDENTKYSISINNNELYGDELMNVGLVTSDASCGDNFEKYSKNEGDFSSRIYELNAIE